MNNPLEKLYCYLRVSSDVQMNDGGSLDVQRNTGKRVSKKLGLQYVELYEGSSSTMVRTEEELFNSPRPVYTQLKDLIRDGKVKHLWVFTNSRLHRDTREEGMFFGFYIEPNKVRFYTGERPEEQRFDTPDDFLQMDIKSLFSRHQKETTSYLSRKGKRERLERDGKRSPFLGGTVNFGYEVVDKCFSKHKIESKYLKEIFQMYLQGGSLKEIGMYLDTNEITPRRSKRWSLGSLHKILMNKIYIGEYRWIDKKTEEEFFINTPRLVSHSLFNRVQDKLTENQKNKGSNLRKNHSLLSDFLHCYCGENITSMIKMKHNTGPKKYYYCHSRENHWKGKKVEFCDNRRTLNMDSTDELVKESVKRIVENSSYLKEKFKTDVLSVKSQHDGDIEIEKDKKQISIDNLNKQLEVVIESQSVNEVQHLTKRTDEQVYKRVKKMLENERIELEDKKKILIKQIDDLDTQKDWVDWIGKYSDEITNNFSEITSDYLGGVISSIQVKPKFGKNRDNEDKQVGHILKINFRYPIVNDSIEYNDDTNKRKGYRVVNGKKSTSETLTINTGGRGKKKHVPRG